MMIVGTAKYRLKSGVVRSNIPKGQTFVCCFASMSNPYGKFQWEDSSGQSQVSSIRWIDVELVPGGSE